MKSTFIKKASLLCATILSTSFASLTAQTVLQSQDMDMKLNGTLNVHDWEMKAVKGTTKAAFIVNATGKIVTMTHLSFSFPAENLKSEHRAMDKNTYKALNTGKNPNISFICTSSSIKSTGANSYTLSCAGRMTIAGVTKAAHLAATGVYNPANGSFNITGVKKMKMTDYGVKPPTAVMGTIKTGDGITLSFNVELSK